MVERRGPRGGEAQSNLYDAAVREAQQILKSAEQGWWRLGELADQVEAIYKQANLKEFAEAIGVAPCTLARHRDVYRAWQNCALGRELPYTVARELAAHPDREAIVRANPGLTKGEAAKLRREHREANLPKVSEEPKPSKLRSSGKILVEANKTIGVAQELLKEWSTPPRDSISIDDTSMAQLLKASEAWRELVEFFKPIHDQRFDQEAA